MGAATRLQAVIATLLLVTTWRGAADGAIGQSSSGVPLRCDLHASSGLNALLPPATVALRPTSTAPTWMQPDPPPMMRRGSCECHGNICGCCAPLTVQKFLFSSKGCLNFTYNPSELTVTMDLLLDNISIFQCSLSGRNPPPLCIPVPQMPLLAVCIRMYDLQLVNQGLVACINLELRLQGITLFVFSFDCVYLGPDGLVLVKPNATTAALPPPLPSKPNVTALPVSLPSAMLTNLLPASVVNMVGLAQHNKTLESVRIDTPVETYNNETSNLIS